MLGFELRASGYDAGVWELRFRVYRHRASVGALKVHFTAYRLFVPAKKKHAAHVALSSDAQANEPSVVLDIALRTSTIGRKTAPQIFHGPTGGPCALRGPSWRCRT